MTSPLQSAIDEFISDLNTFATGSYVRPEERQFWEPPFAQSAVRQTQQILEQFHATLEEADSATIAEAAALACVDALGALNSAHLDAIFDREEYQEITEILNLGLKLKGFPERLISVEDFEEGEDISDPSADVNA